MDFRKLITYILIFALFSSFAFAVLTDNLYLYYSMENNLTDVSGNGRDGTLNSGGYTSGVVGQGVTLTTTPANYMTVGSTNNFADPMTICSWINPIQSNLYFDYSSNAGTNRLLHIDSSNANNNMGIWDGTNWRNGTISPPTGWGFFCWRFDGTSKMEIFYNATSYGNMSVVSNWDLTGTHTISRNNAVPDFVGYVDEYGIWNRSLTASEISDLYNGGAGLAYPFVVAPAAVNFTITAQDVITKVRINNSNLNATVNGTVYLANATGHIVTPYQDTDANIFNITVNAENFTSNTYNNWNTSNDLLANLTFYYYVNTTFTDPVVELGNQTITLIINKTATVTSTQASLVWNNTARSATKTSFSNYDQYIATFLTPSVTATTNISFTWSYNISRSYDIVSGTLTNNQTVTKIFLDNCSTYNITAINFTVRNEADDSVIANATLGGYFMVWISDPNNYRAFNLSWGLRDDSNYKICINPDYASLQAYAQMEYEASGYSKKTYYFINASFDNTTDNVDLYLIANTTAVTFTVSDQDDNVVQDVYINVLRYDLTTDSYKTVEILKTDENGQAIGNIILTDQWYKFLLTYDGATVLETEAKKILTTTQNFRINLLTDYFTNYDYAEGVACSVTFANATNYFSYTFNDPTGNIAQGCLRVIRRDPYSDTEINESCLSTTTGTINIYIGNATETDGNYYIGYGDVRIGTQKFACASVDGDKSTAWKTYGTTGVFVAFLLIVTLPMIGIWSPIAAVILILVAFITTTITGIFHLSWQYLISLIILGGIVLFKLSRSR